MKKLLAYGVVALAGFVVLPGCMVGGADEEEAQSQDEVATQDLASFVSLACVQPIVTGPCRAAFRRYAFDLSRGRCVQFTYGGCQGNENNFTSMRACHSTCVRYRAP